MMKLKLLLTLWLYGLLATINVQAQELYKWVDDEGVTHYGDALPGHQVDHESFVFSEYQAQSLPADDYYSIQNQLQRLQDRRADDLKRKQQLAEINAAKNPPVQEVYIAPQESERGYYRPAYLPYGFGRSHKGVIAGHYSKPYKHHVPHAKKHHAPVEQVRSGLVSHTRNHSNKAAFSASK